VRHRATPTAVLAPILLILPALAACGGGAPPAAPVARHALEFIPDDWPRALAQAKTAKVPIFVEAWAPW
jgi:hypothetical protein